MNFMISYNELHGTAHLFIFLEPTKTDPNNVSNCSGESIYVSIALKFRAVYYKFTLKYSLMSYDRSLP